MSHLFVGHAFTRKQINELRRALREGIQMVGASLWFADEHAGVGSLFEKVKEGIDQARACIFDISDTSRPNVFLELGYANGRSKPCILICRRGTKIPTDLKGFEFLEYKSYEDLSKQLHATLGLRIGGRQLSKAVILSLAVLAHTPPVRRVDLESDAKKRGVIFDELYSTLAVLEQDGIIAVSDETVEILALNKLDELQALASR